MTHVKQRSIFSTIISNSWWFDNVTIHIVTIHYFLREESQAEANRLTASYHESHKAVSHSLLFVLLFIFIHPYKEGCTATSPETPPCLWTTITKSKNVYYIKYNSYFPEKLKKKKKWWLLTLWKHTWSTPFTFNLKGLY